MHKNGVILHCTCQYIFISSFFFIICNIEFQILVRQNLNVLGKHTTYEFCLKYQYIEMDNEIHHHFINNSIIYNIYSSHLQLSVSIGSFVLLFVYFFYWVNMYSNPCDQHVYSLKKKSPVNDIFNNLQFKNLGGVCNSLYLACKVGLINCYFLIKIY